MSDLEIPFAESTRQYVAYIEVMQDLRFELAAEYLVMAAILAEIKSRLLLPRPPGDNEEEDGPRAELIRRLQAYERSEEHTSELQSLMRISYALFCLKKKRPHSTTITHRSPMRTAST